MTYDAFTRASPTFREAWRNRANTGAAFTVSDRKFNITGLLVGLTACAMFAFAVGFAGYCIWAFATYPWGG